MRKRYKHSIFPELLNGKLLFFQVKEKDLGLVPLKYVMRIYVS